MGSTLGPTARDTIRVGPRRLILVVIATVIFFSVVLSFVERRMGGISDKEAAELQRQEQERRREEQRTQEEAFAQLSASEHLEKARQLLRVDAPQSSIEEAPKHLSAISTTSSEHKDAEILRLQYYNAKKKQELAMAAA